MTFSPFRPSSRLASLGWALLLSLLLALAAQAQPSGTPPPPPDVTPPGDTPPPNPGDPPVEDPGPTPEIDFSNFISISTRGPVTYLPDGIDRTMQVGFAVRGTQPMTVVVRGIGPGLIPFGFTADQVISDPIVTLFRTIDSEGNVLNPPVQVRQVNDYAEETSTILNGTSLAPTTGSFPINAKDGMMVLENLSTGNYTMVLGDVNSGQNRTGISEAYAFNQTTGSGSIPDATYIAISTRGYIGGVDASSMEVGFAVRGDVPMNVVVRGAGPSLALFGFPANVLLPDPTLTVFRTIDELGNVLNPPEQVATNDDWATAANLSFLTGTSADPNSPGWTFNEKDSVIVLLGLEVGNYTVRLVDKNGAAGIGIAEVYSLDDL